MVLLPADSKWMGLPLLSGTLKIKPTMGWPQQKTTADYDDSTTRCTQVCVCVGGVCVCVCVCGCTCVCWKCFVVSGNAPFAFQNLFVGSA